MVLEAQPNLKSEYEREMLSRKLAARFKEEKRNFGIAEFLERTNGIHPMLVGIDIKTEKDTGCVVNLDPQILGEGPALAYQIYRLVKRDVNAPLGHQARHRFATLGLRAYEDHAECIIEIGNQGYTIEDDLKEDSDELNKLLQDSYEKSSQPAS